MDSKILQVVRRLHILGILDSYRPSYYIEFLRKSGKLSFVLQPLVDCIGVEQGSRHNETVYEHCLMAADFISYKTPILRLAALLHDVGKPSTKEITQDGLVSFHGHESVGAAIARKWMTEVGYPDTQEERDHVETLIRNHMFFFDTGASRKAYKRFARKTRGKLRDDLMMLRIADRASNLAKIDRPLVTKKMLYLIDKCNEIDAKDAEPQFKLAINGHDLINMGYEPSKKFSKVIGCLTKQVQDNQMENNREELLKEAKKLMAT